MHHLLSDTLRVSILDPEADRAKLGSRYCVGGYIWQVDDLARGPLTSGPSFPDTPSLFDGQGLPEVSEIALGQDKTPVGGEVTVIGVGKVPRTSPVKPFHVRDNHAVSRFETWESVVSHSDALFRTVQEHDGHALELTRRIAVSGRTVLSSTTVQNRSALRLPVRWFAHPFFPWEPSRVFRFSTEARLPENRHWRLDADGWVRRSPAADWLDGSSFLPLVLPFGYPLEIEQAHPVLGTLRMACDFPLAHLPIWGNARTVSCEPYFHTVVEPTASASWSIAYTF